ncbi:MAG: hypothetical protein ACYC03_11820, partial [Acidovorax defluvii]
AAVQRQGIQGWARKRHSACHRIVLVRADGCHRGEIIPSVRGVCTKCTLAKGDPQSREACEDFLAAIVFFADKKMSQNRLEPLFCKRW